MADISIVVNSKGLYTITLDVWEWQSLTVNGKPVPKYSGPLKSVQYQWVQSTPGPVSFHAVANHNIEILNPSYPMFMVNEKTGSATTPFCSMTYSDYNNHIHVNGLCSIVQSVIPAPPAQNSPILFSQGRMTGKFVYAK